MTDQGSMDAKEIPFVTTSGISDKDLDWQVFGLGEYLSQRIKNDSSDGDFMTYWEMYNRVFHQQKRGWESADEDMIVDFQDVSSRISLP